MSKTKQKENTSKGEKGVRGGVLVRQATTFGVVEVKQAAA
jgi:hypothetical protein